jgi:hypothetical protein
VSAQQAGAAQASSEPVIYLNQGWSQEDREWYYHFSQGSAFLSYDIYLNLEVADSQDLLRSGARYGLLPGTASLYNPDGLPIGISKTTVATPIKGWPAGDYAGVTCAACHEGELTYKGKRIRIQGGNSPGCTSAAISSPFWTVTCGPSPTLRAWLSAVSTTI